MPNSPDISPVTSLSSGQWIQLVWDCSFNALSVIEDKTPQQLLSDPKNRASLVRLMSETIRAGAREGVSFPDNLINYNLKSFYADQAKPSMLLAYKNGLPVEFEAANGYVIKLAEKHNILLAENLRVYNRLKQL